jgi:hypothetical protein
VLTLCFKEMATTQGQGQGQGPAVASVCVVIETSLGNVEFELYTNHAPKTCFNFSRLADMGYYNDTVFHRVIKDFVSAKLQN